MLYTASVSRTWHRFTSTVGRAPARRAGLTNTAFAAQVRLSYVKVAEYQPRRGPLRPRHHPPLAVEALGAWRREELARTRVGLSRMAAGIIRRG